MDLGRGRTVRLLRPARVPFQTDSEAAAAAASEELLSALRATSLYGAGDVVWPAAVALARLVAHCPSLVTGARVLELGAGLGLPSCAAAAAGAAHVTLSDRDAPLLQFALRSVALNGAREAAALTACFSEASPPWPAGDGENAPTVVLASDVLYDADTARAVAQLLGRLLQSPSVPLPAGAAVARRALLADEPQRQHRELFAAECDACGLLVEQTVLPGPEKCILLHVVCQ